MIGGIVAFFKGLAVALGWAKQHKDEKTGAALQRGKDNEDTLKALADDRVRDSRDELSKRVRDDHGIRSDP